MQEQSISLETSELATSKGFDRFKVQESIDVPIGDVSIFTHYPLITQSFLQKWLREDHIIYVSVERAVIGSDEWDYGYKIEWLPKPHHSEKRRCGLFQEKQSFQELIGSYMGAWSKYEEALEKGLQAALKLI